MKGDFTRFTFDPSKQYVGVRKQQGRVDLDADWNEAADIQAYLAGIQARDVLGAVGIPKKTMGFLVSVSQKVDGGDDEQQLPDLGLSAGRLYLNGLL